MSKPQGKYQPQGEYLILILPSLQVTITYTHPGSTLIYVIGGLQLAFIFLILIL